MATNGIPSSNINSELLKMLETMHLSYIVLIEHKNLDPDAIPQQEKERLREAFNNFTSKLDKEREKFSEEDDIDAINVIIESCNAIINAM